MGLGTHSLFIEGSYTTKNTTSGKLFEKEYDDIFWGKKIIFVRQQQEKKNETKHIGWLLKSTKPQSLRQRQICALPTGMNTIIWIALAYYIRIKL